MIKDIDPEINLTIGAVSGETLILDKDGRLLCIEDLSYDCDDSVTVLAFDDYQRLVLTEAYNFRIGEWVDECYKITLANGQSLQASPKQKILTSSLEWIPIEEVSFGTAIKTAIYDPSQKHPLHTFQKVEHIHKETLESKIPFFSFDVKNKNNLLVGNMLKNEKIISLLPVHAGIKQQ